jgi:malic enzyme
MRSTGASPTTWPRTCTWLERYDELIDAYVTTATRLFPNALLHWEESGAANAHRILTKYAGTCCTFIEHALRAMIR